MPDFRPLVLGKVCTKIASGATPRGGKEAYGEGRTALIRSQNVYNDRFVREGLAFVDDAQAHDLRNVTIEDGDVLLNITGDSLARCCQVDRSVLPARVNQHVAVIRPQPDLLDARFLRYALIAPAMQARLRSLGSAGATRNALTKAMIEALVVEAPPAPQQRAIAHVLGTLDDRIQLNRSMNDTLEAMAVALFHSWFVHFDPVRAKLEGRAPCGMDADTASLFPSEFWESSLARIPKGWEVKTLKETSRLVMGQSPPGESYNQKGQGLPFFQGCSDFGFRFPSRRVSCTSPTRVAEAGDTLMSVRAPVGSLNMASERSAVGRGIAVLRHASGSRSFSYYLCKSIQKKLESFNAEGTVFGSINKSNLENVLHVEPTGLLVRAFDMYVGPMDDRIECAANEMAHLTRVRDDLLPRLLSGEVSVAQAEKEMGGVA